MSITQAQLLESIRSAYSKVLQYVVEHPNQQTGNLSILQSRSFEWVRLLALELQQHWAQQPGVQTHFKQLESHAPSTAGELLTDIQVVQTKEVPSIQKGTLIPVATSSLLAVESEFAHDSRELLYDLGKLFMVRAPWLIFVSSRAGRKSDQNLPTSQLRMYAEAARLGLPVGANLLIAVMTDPTEWHKGAAENELQTYQYSVSSQSLEQVFST
jgi:hypothetical protein